VTPVAVVLYALGALALAAGLAGVVLPALPGSLLLVVGAVLLGWAEDFQRVGFWTIGFAGLIAVAIWAVDLLAAALGAKAFGASRWAVIGAGVGLLAGLFLGFPGIVLGPAVGAVVFEYAKDPDFPRAAKAGLGAFLGFLLGSVVKVVLAFALIGAVVLALLV
jgi:uncharacterized protein YqgC (DUF456 family)